MSEKKKIPYTKQHFARRRAVKNALEDPTLMHDPDYDLQREIMYQLDELETQVDRYSLVVEYDHVQSTESLFRNIFLTQLVLTFGTVIMSYIARELKYDDLQMIFGIIATFSTIICLVFFKAYNNSTQKANAIRNNLLTEAEQLSFFRELKIELNNDEELELFILNAEVGLQLQAEQELNSIMRSSFAKVQSQQLEYPLEISDTVEEFKKQNRTSTSPTSLVLKTSPSMTLDASPLHQEFR